MDQKQSKSKLTTKQVVYIAQRMNGRNKKDSARIAGYDENTSTTMIEKPKAMREALLAAMEHVGLNEQYLAKKLKQGLEAKREQLITFQGQVMGRAKVADNETQHKYFRDALEIRGDIKSNVVDSINIGVVQVPGNVDDGAWNNPSPGPDSLSVTDDKPSDSGEDMGKTKEKP